MKRSILIALVHLVVTATSAFAWPTVYATGTTLYDPEKAYSGYMLYTPMDFKPPKAGEVYRDGTSRNTRAILLINMKGSILHVWELPFDPLFGQLLPNGHLVVMGYDGKSPYTIPGTAGKIVEFDWDGKVVFEHEDLSMHHDFARLPNGGYLYLAFEKVPKALQAKVRGGIKGAELRNGEMLGERIVEVNAKGKVVWEWHANQHLDPDIDIIGPNYTREEWLHCNSIEVLGNGDIAVSSRQTDSVIIIDKESGKILHRWGSPTYLDKKTGRIEYHNSQTKTQYLGGCHDVRRIPAGYPGAGNLTVYDNGMFTYASRAVEMNPANGELVWFSRQPGLGRKQFSNFTGSAERLPNGNTLMCEGANGRFVQVTPENEVVWEYINPYVPSQNFQGAVLKVDMYAPDFCPQFKKLAPAKSEAITPPDNDRITIARLLKTGEEEKPATASDTTTAPPTTDTPPTAASGSNNLVPTAVAFIATALLAFFVGWRLPKKQ